MLPLLVAVALALGQLLAAGAARELAGHAAEAAAIAIGRGEDPRDAARDALPGWSRERLRVRGRRPRGDGDGHAAPVRPAPRRPPPRVGDRRRGAGAVTGLFDRLGSAFVAPPGAERRRGRGTSRRPPRSRARARAPPHVGRGRASSAGRTSVRGRRGRRRSLLAARARSSHALLAVWGAGGAGRPRAGDARRRGGLAAALAARGHDATATGRLAVVALAGALGEAAAEAARAAAAAGDVPSVVVLAGPASAGGRRAPPRPGRRARRRAGRRGPGRRRPRGARASPTSASRRGSSASRRERRRPARSPRPASRPCRRSAPRSDACGATGARRWSRALDARVGERGQASVLLVGGLLAVLVGGLVLAWLARGVDAQASQQRAADLAALAGARAMYELYPRLFEPAFVGGAPNPRHLDVAAYRAAGERVALETARRNGARSVEATLPDAESFAPVRIAVTVRDPITVDGRQVAVAARAEAELAPPATLGDLGAGEYKGPLELRQGKPMRPDVARAFDRMARAARADGVGLIVVSAFRSNAEQAILFARHPDPKWVAPPGPVAAPARDGARPRPARGVRLAGPQRDAVRLRAALLVGALALRLHAERRDAQRRLRPGGRAEAAMPSFVPQRFAPAISRAAQRWNVGAALLAAQLYAESNFNPFARSPAGAQGIAQFMPGTAAAYGLRNPFDADAGDRRPGPPDARPAPPVRQRPARARRLQRRPGAGPGLRLHPAVPGDARLRRAHPRPARAARATRSAAASRCGWCGDVAAPTIPSMALTVADRDVRPLTVDEVMRMVELGILAEDERVELLHGVLTEKAVKGPEHEALKTRLLTVARRRRGARNVLRQGRGRVHRPRPDLVSRAGPGRHRARPTRSSTRRPRCSSSRCPGPRGGST